MLSPADRSALLVAKALALFIYMTVLELVAVPAFALLLLGSSLGAAMPGLLAVLASEGMGPADLVKITYFTTDGSAEALKLSREIRARKLGDANPSSTYLVIAGLAGPDLKVEIEGEAVAAG